MMPEKKNTIGRFEIVEKIGEGPIGTVYKALDPVIRRTVAIKVIKLYALEETTTFAEIFEKIYRVVRTSTSLNHPNICIIYDLSEEKKIPYITMEYVDGNDLDSLLRKKHQFKKGELLNILQQTSDALDFAHRKNVIHQDLKSTNILINPDFHVKITDFGIAGLDEIAAAQTKKLLTIPFYISPEQALGERVSPASDLFSLGVVIYHLLSGQLPFPGTSAANTIMMIARDHPKIPTELEKSGISRDDWDSFFSIALAKSPSHRFRSARETYEALAAILPASEQSYYPYTFTGEMNDSTGKYLKSELVDTGSPTLMIDAAQLSPPEPPAPPPLPSLEPEAAGIDYSEVSDTLDAVRAQEPEERKPWETTREFEKESDEVKTLPESQTGMDAEKAEPTAEVEEPAETSGPAAEAVEAPETPAPDVEAAEAVPGEPEMAVGEAEQVAEEQVEEATTPPSPPAAPPTEMIQIPVPPPPPQIPQEEVDAEQSEEEEVYDENLEIGETMMVSSRSESVPVSADDAKEEAAVVPPPLPPAAVEEPAPEPVVEATPEPEKAEQASPSFGPTQMLQVPEFEPPQEELPAPEPPAPPMTAEPAAPPPPPVPEPEPVQADPYESDLYNAPTRMQHMEPLPPEPKPEPKPVPPAPIPPSDQKAPEKKPVTAAPVEYTPAPRPAQAAAEKKKPNLARYMIGAVALAILIGLIGTGILIFGKKQPEQVNQPQPTIPAPTPPTPVNPPGPEAPATGSMSIMSDPEGATVFIDEEDKGVTPLDLKDLELKKYALRLELKGYEDTLFEIELTEETPNTTIPFTLTKAVPETGTLVINSEPSGALIVIKNRALGNTPKTLPNTRVGNYNITLKLDGYEDFQAMIRVNAGQTANLNGKLIEVPKPPAPPPEPPKPTKPEIKRGQLVTLGPGVVPPRATKKIYPKYPEAARVKKIAGTVKMDILVDETGKVIDMRVTESAHPMLDEAVMEAYRQWVFEPATKDGVQVKVWMPVTMTFQSR